MNRVNRDIYSPSLPDKVREAVRAVEGRARARLLKPEHLEKILAALAAHPAGKAVADGGAVALRYRGRAETTELVLWWYTRRGAKEVMWSVYRTSAPRKPWGRGPVCNLDTGPEGRRVAFSTLYPERYARLRHLKCLRRLRPLGVVAPPGTLVRVHDANERFRLAVVWTRESGFMFLCTPVGCFRLSSWKAGVPKAVREVTGENLPRSRKATWEDIEPLFLMAALERL